MATKFIESGTDATQGFEFYASTSGTVASDTTAFTGSRAIKHSTGSPAVSAIVNTAAGVLADAGRRVSYAFRFDAAPAALATTGAVGNTSGGAGVWTIRMNTDQTMNINPVGGTAVSGAVVLATSTWYRMVVSYFITNTTTYTIKLYIHDANFTLLETITASAGTLTRTASSILQFLIGAGAGTNRNMWIDDIYVDDGASSGSQPDQVDIRVTAKRPFANGTTNGYTTQIGSGGSGYGTGHAPQVNEIPMSVTNGWSMIGAGAAVTEEYNIEGRSVGDVDIGTSVIVDYVGWVYSKTLSAETAQIIVNGTTSNIALTTTITIFTAFAASVTYPAGTGTDIGEITSTAVTTVSLYECGIVVAYSSAIKTLNSLLRTSMKTVNGLANASLKTWDGVQ